MKAALATLLLCVAMPVAAQPAATAAGALSPAGAGVRSAEPDVRRTVIEDDTARIDELRVRGVTRRIVVTPKGPTAPYEILVGDGSHDLAEGANTSRGSVGRRVWRVLDF